MPAPQPLLGVLGGIALFLFSMSLLAESLRQVAAGWLRRALGSATRSPPRGLALGAGLGFLMHSSATTVLLLGFIDAGLLSLASAVPPVLGANIGTTFAMQVIALHVGDYWMIPLLLGVACGFARRYPSLRRAGRMGTGFGLLLLGFVLMSDAVAPYRADLLPWLAGIDSASAAGLVKGILAGLVLALVLQSSGAVIGMCFALIAGGAATRLEQVFPVILGAHVGTCSTALLAALGGTPDARRLALFHLFANLWGVALAAAVAPWLVPLLRSTSPDLIHQAANAHTGVMLLAMLPLAPWPSPIAGLLKRMIRFRAPDPEPSHLDPDLLHLPERALAACIRELQRVARLGEHSLRRNAALLLGPDGALAAGIERDESVTDEIQLAMRGYLTALSARALSRRQALMVQHLERCMTDIERVGDHNNNLCELSMERHRRRQRLPASAVEQLVRLFAAADQVLRRVSASLDPDGAGFRAAAQAILDARDRYAELSASSRTLFMNQTAGGELTPLQGMLLADYVLEIDRIVRHSRLIALVEQHPYFWIRPEKLGLEAPEADYPEPPPESNGHLAAGLSPDRFP